MPTRTFRAGVWEEVRINLSEQYDDLDRRIYHRVDDSGNWREQITLALTDGEAAEVDRIIEAEDLNTD